MTVNEKENFFGMTRKEAIALADELCDATDDNNPTGAGSYFEYIETRKKGREALKKQKKYYRHLPTEV